MITHQSLFTIASSRVYSHESVWMEKWQRNIPLETGDCYVNVQSRVHDPHDETFLQDFLKFLMHSL